MALAGFAFTAFVFFPGVMTWDARFVYDMIPSWNYGDWQSPVMTVLWTPIAKVMPGPGGMFLLITGLFWGAVGLLAHRLWQQSRVAALLLVALALSPPVFLLLGIVWRDVLLAALWLLAAALAYRVAARPADGWRLAAQAFAVVLVLLGLLIRTNALFATPVMLAYVLAPQAFAWKRLLIAYVPAVALLFGLMQVTFYTVLDAKRQNPTHSIFVFDLGGMSHFAGQNLFPAAYTPEESRQIVEECYEPAYWDAYWTWPKCRFVMARLDGGPEAVFGTPALSRAWREALLAHPVAYLQHRLSHFRALMLRENLVMFAIDTARGSGEVFTDRRAFQAARAVERALLPTPVLRGWPYVLAAMVIVVLALRRMTKPEGAFALALAGSAVIYVLTYLPFGVAAEFRYTYWSVVATMAALPVLLARR
jgi:hypothetical protein